MSETSKIEWTDYTFNPWWGCTKVSAGCKNCYAEAHDARFKGDHWGDNASRRHFGDKHWGRPVAWNVRAEKDGRRFRVFCASMADVFELHPNPEELELQEQARQRLWKLIEETPNLDWLLLTKRPENQYIVPVSWKNGFWKPDNVWFGTTAENQEQADARIPHLLQASWAAVRFVSYEPALGPINLDPPHCQYGCVERYGRDFHVNEGMAFCNHCDSEMGFGAWLDPLNGGIDWVIAGAESGRKARPMEEEWVRKVRDQCKRNGVSFFYKQKLADGKKVSLPVLDGRTHAEFPL